MDFLKGSAVTDYLIPLLLLGISVFALRKKEDPYSLMIQGGKEGIRLLISLAPVLMVLLTSVSMLRACGGMDILSSWFAPAFRILGIPPETAMLVLIRPISGSAALAVGADLMCRYGVDSVIGRTAAVMLGSTETTFYVISMYFGTCGIKKTRYTIPAALAADLTGFVAAAMTVRFFY